MTTYNLPLTIPAMKCSAIFTSITLLIALALPAGAKAPFKLPTCDEVTPAKEAPAVELPAVKLPIVSKSQVGGSAIKQAEKINAMPLPLIPSESETSAIEGLTSDAERAQIRELWSAALERSQDIQFVLNALQPTNDASKSRGNALKMIGGAMFDGVTQAAPLMVPNSAGMRLGTGAVANSLSTVLHRNSKSQGPDVSPASLAALYSMIRRTADRLTDSYRGYRTALDNATLLEEDTDDIYRMMSSVQSTTSDTAVFFDLQLRRSLREVKLAQRQVVLFRKQLEDMSGTQALAALDNAIEDEHNALARLTGSASWRDPLKYTGPASCTQQLQAPTP